MSHTLQIDVDPFLCASQEREISGELLYEKLQRIQGDIESSSDPIEANLRFSKVGKFVVLTGRISANLVLQCVACLGPIDFPVDIEVKLAIINDESLVNLLPDGYEPYLLDGDRLSISEVVEDEVVIVLPDFARHEICPIGLPQNSASKDFSLEPDRKKNPFEVLKSLKKH